MVVYLTTYCQTPKKMSKWKYNPQASTIPHFGYAWQGINTFDVGLRLFTLGVHENISLMANVIVFQQDVTYASPEAKLRYFKPLNLSKTRPGLIGIECAVSYWTTEVLSTREQRITPEIGIGFNQWLHFCYGYNIPISKNEVSFISTNRFSIRFTLN